MKFILLFALSMSLNAKVKFNISPVYVPSDKIIKQQSQAVFPQDTTFDEHVYIKKGVEDGAVEESGKQYIRTCGIDQSIAVTLDDPYKNYVCKVTTKKLISSFNFGLPKKNINFDEKFAAAEFYKQVKPFRSSVKVKGNKSKVEVPFSTNLWKMFSTASIYSYLSFDHADASSGKVLGGLKKLGVSTDGVVQSMRNYPHQYFKDPLKVSFERSITKVENWEGDKDIASLEKHDGLHGKLVRVYKEKLSNFNQMIHDGTITYAIFDHNQFYQVVVYSSFTIGEDVLNIGRGPVTFEGFFTDGLSYIFSKINEYILPDKRSLQPKAIDSIDSLVSEGVMPDGWENAAKKRLSFLMQENPAGLVEDSPIESEGLIGVMRELSESLEEHLKK